MELKVTTTKIISLNTDVERERIKGSFKRDKDVQKWLLDMLSDFEQGNFNKLADEATFWKRSNLEYIHPVIFDTLKVILEDRNFKHLNKSSTNVEVVSKINVSPKTPEDTLMEYSGLNI